jgi:hypothetical protein
MREERRQKRGYMLLCVAALSSMERDYFVKGKNPSMGQQFSFIFYRSRKFITVSTKGPL